jgi:hypothetical protein
MRWVALRARTWLAAWLLFAVVPAAAQAQAADDARASEYRRTIKEALHEYQLGNWSEALALFEAAHALQPNARTLRGMGIALFENRRYAEARANLRAALEDPRNALTDELRRSTEEVLARTERFVARVPLQLVPASAVLTVDGARIEVPDSGVLILDPGEHELAATAPDHAQRSVRVQSKSGTNATVELALTPLSGAAAQAPGAVRGGARSPTEKAEANGTADALMIGGFVAAGVGVAVGTVTGLLTLEEGKSLQDMCPDNGCDPKLASDIDGAETLGMVSNIAFGVAIAGAGLAVAGLVLANSGDETPAQPRARVEVGLGLGSAVLRGTF